MNYTFTLRRVDPKRRLLGVIYHVEGRDDYFTNFNIDDFSRENIEATVAAHASRVLEYWENYDAAPGSSGMTPGETGVGRALKDVEESQPDFNPLTQRLEQTETVDEEAGTRTRGWTVVDLPEEDAMRNLMGKVASDRYQKESGGLIWTDPNTGEVFYLDTTSASQARFAAARTTVETGERSDGAVWKCADITDGQPVVTFRPTSNAELVEWSHRVHVHVQKCFDAEAVATRLLLAGDLTASFEDAFNNL